jgi:parallel beta-helix repeat protein
VSNIRKTLISVALFLFFFSLISNVYAATPISSCTVINSPGEYVLVNDILDYTGDYCIKIQVNDVTLNCQWHTIDGIDGFGSTGIDIGSGISNVNITNCIIRDWEQGIYLEPYYSENITLINNTFISNYMGANFFQLEFADIINNTFYQNTRAGLYFSYGCGLNIHDNIFRDNNYGIEFFQVPDCAPRDSIQVTPGYIYNNIFNNTENIYIYDTSTIYYYYYYWNVTKQSGSNIWNPSLGYIGGNLWTNPSNTGYSDNCTDADYDGFCDQPYNLFSDGSNIDYLPIAKYVGQNVPYTPITGCTVITSPGEYRLVNDILNFSGDYCIKIQANNVTLDCQWHVISGVTTSSTLTTNAGIQIVSGYSNNTVRNCILGNFTTGLTLGSGTSFNNIRNIVIRDYNYLFGIYLFGSNNNSISNVTSLNQVVAAIIELANSNYNVLSNIYHNYSGTSLIIINSQYNTITNSTFVNDKIQIGLSSSDSASYNLFFNNIFNSTTILFANTKVENYWNTTLTPGTNIVGGPYIGGNYWGKIDGTGFSDTCVDANHDGICDSNYTVASNNTDYLPLTKYIPPSFSVVFNYNSVDFGTVTPNTIAEAKSINYNVSITTNTNYKVSVNATDWSGATTIPANTLYFAVNDTLDKLSFATAKQLSNAVQLVATFPSSVTTNYHAFYFNVPVVPVGTYTATVTITYEVV